MQGARPKVLQDRWGNAATFNWSKPILITNVQHKIQNRSFLYLKELSDVVFKTQMFLHDIYTSLLPAVCHCINSVSKIENNNL